MTEEDYNRIFEDRPDLMLPPYYRITGEFRCHLAGLSSDQFIAARTYALLAREHPSKSVAVNHDGHFHYV